MKLKQSVTSLVNCNCTCCTNYSNCSEDLQRAILFCRELDISYTNERDQNGSRVLDGLMEFAASEANLKAVHCPIKFVNL